jgi:hypothetical protein
MLLVLLSILDLAAGALLSLSGFLQYTNSGFIGILAAFMIIKGIWSIITAAAANFFFDIIGMIDLAAGALLFVTTLGTSFHFFVYVGIALILKGAYSFIVGMAGR